MGFALTQQLYLGLRVARLLLAALLLYNGPARSSHHGLLSKENLIRYAL